MKFTILHYPELDSTNNLAKEFAAGGVRSGTVILTDYQTKGRGQFSRKWISPRGKDLLFSVVIRPQKIKAGAASILTQVIAESIQDTLKADLDIDAQIKRPNDLLVDGKKICGILVESSTKSSHIEYMVAGVGLNVNSKAKDLVGGATSILEVKRKMTEKNDLLESLLKSLARHLKGLGWKNG